MNFASREQHSLHLQNNVSAGRRNIPGWKRSVIPNEPLVGNRKITLHQVLQTPAEPPFNICGWDMMSALQNTLRNTFDCIEDACDAQVMELQAIARCSSVLKKRNVCFSAKRAFESKALTFCDTTFNFGQ